MDIPGLLPSKVPGLSGIFMTFSGWPVPVADDTSAAVVGLDVVVLVETAVIEMLIALLPFPLALGFVLLLVLLVLLLLLLFVVTLLLQLPLLLFPLFALAELPLLVLQLLTAVTLTTPSLAMS